MPGAMYSPTYGEMQVQAELDGLGLNSATLAHLKSLSDQEKSSTRKGSAFQYSFNGNLSPPRALPRLIPTQEPRDPFQDSPCLSNSRMELPLMPR